MTLNDVKVRQEAQSFETLSAATPSPKPTERTLPDPLPFLEQIAALGPRQTCGPMEARAASMVRDFFESLGLKTAVHSFRANPAVFRPHALAFLLALAMTAVVTLMDNKPLAFCLAALGAFLAAKFYTHTLNNRETLLSRLLPKGTSQNVLTKIAPRGEVKNRIVLLAHLDSARCSIIYSRGWARYLRSHVKANRYVIVACGFLYLLGALTASSVPYDLALGLSLYTLGSLGVVLWSQSFSPVSPGANDNASGAGALMSLAQSFAQAPLENTELWCICLGAEESGAHGSKALWESHADLLRHSYIVNIDSIGTGLPRYLVNEGFSETYDCDFNMIAVLEEIARQDESYGLKPLVFKGWGGFTDVTHLLRKGCRAITIASTNDHGFVPNWHTPGDLLEAIEPHNYRKSVAAIQTLVLRLDEPKWLLKDAHERSQPLRENARLKIRVIPNKELADPNFDLKALLWPSFDEDAQNIFQTSAYLQAQARSSNLNGGFILIEEKRPFSDALPLSLAIKQKAKLKATRPVASCVFMVPYFIYYELVDDSPSPYWVRKIFRSLKKNLLPLGLTFLPGFKTVFLGTPFTQPSNQFFIRPGVTLRNLMYHRPWRKAYHRALGRLKSSYLPMVVSHFHFEETAEHNAFFQTLGFSPHQSWPDMYLDSGAIRRGIKLRYLEVMQRAQEHLKGVQDKLVQLGAAQTDLLQQLLEDPFIRSKVQESAIQLDEEQKQLLLAAEAQNQMDDLKDNLRTGKYIEVLKTRTESLREQREEMFSGYDALSLPARNAVEKLSEMEDTLKGAEKAFRATETEVNKLEEKLQNLLAKSLANKYSGACPESLEAKVEFFLSKREEINDPSAPLPPGWNDISAEDLQRRLKDLSSTWLELDQKRSQRLRALVDIQELKNQRAVLTQKIETILGRTASLPKLLQAEIKTRDILKNQKSLQEETIFFQAYQGWSPAKVEGGLSQQESHLPETPERDRLKKALMNARTRRETAIHALGITNGWYSLAAGTRKKLRDLANIHLEIRKVDLKNAEKAHDKSRRECMEFNEVQPPSFSDYIDSLRPSHRYAVRKNLERIATTDKYYVVEVITDPKRILDLSYEMSRAYAAQISQMKVQWIRMTAEYFRQLAWLPGTEVLVCWHLLGLSERRFAGFIINLDGQFNHRMGISPEYRVPEGIPEDRSPYEFKDQAEYDVKDDHLIYFRLTYKNIEENLKRGKKGMWIAQTTYEAKRRMGFTPHRLVSYRRTTRFLGTNLWADYLYEKTMGYVQDPDILYHY